MYSDRCRSSKRNSLGRLSWGCGGPRLGIYSYGSSSGPFGPSQPWGMPVPQQQLPPGTAMPPTYTGAYPTYEDVWWTRAENWLAGKLGLRNVADEDDFWMGAQQGMIMCAGPFTPVQVLELLERASPEQVERVKMSVYARSWYRKFPPQTLPQLAGMLVAEAHGGRDCTPNDMASLAVVQALRSLAGEAPPEAGPGVDFPPGLEGDVAGIGTLLGLGILGAGAYFLWQKVSGRP